MNLKVIGIIAIMLASVMVLGCIEQESPAKAPSTQVPTDLNLKVGETAKTSTIEVSVISVKKGEGYIWVDAEIKNVGDDRTRLGYTEFSISDSEGYKYDPADPYIGRSRQELLDRMEFQELYQNQKMKGRILFYVPKNATNLKVIYDFGNSLASWSIE